MILNGANTDNFMHRMITWSRTDLPPIEEWDALVTLAIEGANTTRKYNLPYNNLLDLHDIHRRFVIERDAEMAKWNSICKTANEQRAAKKIKASLNVPWSTSERYDDCYL